MLFRKNVICRIYGSISKQETKSLFPQIFFRKKISAIL